MRYVQSKLLHCVSTCNILCELSNCFLYYLMLLYAVTRQMVTVAVNKRLPNSIRRCLLLDRFAQEKPGDVLRDNVCLSLHIYAERLCDVKAILFEIVD